jgi:hypothetical protein
MTEETEQFHDGELEIFLSCVLGVVTKDTCQANTVRSMVLGHVSN